MRLFAAARLAPAAVRVNASNARRRASKSSSEARPRRQHRVEHFSRNAVRLGALEVLCAQALDDEVVDFADQRIDACIDVRQRLLPDGAPEQLDQIQLEPVLEHDAQHADGGAPQRERVARATRFLANGEDTRQRVELVGQGDGIADDRARQRIPGAARQVVFADGLGHIGRFAIRERVVAPHDALQFGKLAHHGGRQVAFAESRGARGIGHVFRAGAGGAGNPLGECRDTPRASALRAELCLEGNVLESGEARCERLPAILFPEELGIGQPRSHHALVAGTHHGRLRAVDVADRDEPGHELARCIFEREVTLVVLQRRDQHFARQRQVARVELTGDRHGPLHQCSDFLEQRLGQYRAALQAQRQRFDLGAQDLLPFVEQRNHAAALLQQPLIAGGRAQFAWRRAP